MIDLHFFDESQTFQLKNGHRSASRARGENRQTTAAKIHVDRCVQGKRKECGVGSKERQMSVIKTAELVHCGLDQPRIQT